MSTTSTKKLERRFVTGLEVREAAAGDKGSIGTLTGYAALFGVESLDLGGFREVIRKGAFKVSLDRGDDVRALADHEACDVLGRRSVGTLEIAEDDKGLKVTIHLPDTTAGRDTLASVKRGDKSGMSFGFNTVNDEWTRNTVDGTVVYKRELIDADLYEVSVVTWPAYEETLVEARSITAEQLAAAKLKLEAKSEPKVDQAALEARKRRIENARRHMDLWTV